MINKFKLTLVKKEVCADKLLHLYFKQTEPIGDVPKVDFAAGQYLAFIVGENVKRFYSIASMPSSEHFEFFVATTPGGPGSQFFENIKEGDNTDVMGPMGVFTFKSNADSIFVATGTGVAPFWSMINDQLAKGNPNSIQLIFGVRSEENLFFKEKIEALSSRYSNFKPIITLSQPSEAWTGQSGRVTEHLSKLDFGAVNAKGTDFYICGIKEMILDAKQMLLDHGVPANKIFTEMY